MTTDNPQDIRWQQRLQNFQAAFNELDEAVALSNTRELSKLEEQGLIQTFEYTYELAWNTVKDFYQNQGETGIQGSRDAIRLAFERSLIVEGLPVGVADQLRASLGHYPDVRQVLLFGSRAMGTHRPNSDIDLCLDAPEMSFPTYLQLAAHLDEQLLP